jgi:para-nitrobenzyl esterase
MRLSGMKRGSSVCAMGLVVGVAGLLGGGWAEASGPEAVKARPVEIDSGKVLGVLSADGKVIAYKGIPYAMPPLEDLRWEPPQPVGRWKHVLFAGDFGPHCIQFLSTPDIVFHDPGPSEDCLTLNVWAPADARPVKKVGGLPVMVWIYGGGFAAGGTSESGQDGEAMARGGVVVVSMNYRLGVLGFMTHPELTAESPSHASGNYGLMDQTAAMAWVRRNAAAFGGDPANVTISGEPAGSISVSLQMASPLAKGLFAKAIGEGGGGRGPEPRERSEQATVAWAERAFGSSKLFYLRSLTTDDLTRASGGLSWGPVIDGYFLPDSGR